MRAGISLEAGPRIHVEIPPMWAKMDSLEVGIRGSRRVLSRVAVAYSDADVAVVCQIISEMYPARAPRVAAHKGSMSITYWSQRAPAACLVSAGTITSIGFPALTRVHAVTSIELPEGEVPEEFQQRLKRHGEFILVITGPDKDVSDPFIVVGIRTLHDEEQNPFR